MLGKIKAALRVLRAGEEVANPAAWKNAQIGVNVLTALLVALAAAAAEFGVDLQLTEAQLESAAYGVFALLGVYNAIVTAATTKKTGLLPAQPADPNREARG
jgi:hypothetical protein